MKINHPFHLLLAVPAVCSLALLFASCAVMEAAETGPYMGAAVAAEGEPAASSDDRDAAGTPADEMTTAVEPAGGEEKSAAARGARGEEAEEGDVAFMTEDSEEGPTSRSVSTAEPGGPTPSASGLKAGFADDNKQFNYFLSFLQEFSGVEHYPLAIQERLILKIVDPEGRSIPNADVSILAGDAAVARGRSYADGTFLLFPQEAAADAAEYQAVVTFGQQRVEITVLRDGPRALEIMMPQPRPAYQQVPLDLLFILDTTGSMGEEIERLKTTIGIIQANLAALSSRPKVRFGMVLYKDLGDEYRTKVVPLTEDLDGFQSELNRVTASGGGDYPEDLQAALEDAVNAVEWNTEGIRLGFIITDATAHLSTYDQPYTYAHAARDAKRNAVKLFSVGTGGLDVAGEYVLRQISQFTSARYIFLTYGEQGESEGGAPGSVSHHTGANYQTDRLEVIIIRFAKEELSHLTNQPIEEGEDYYQARKIADETKEETLSKLFDEAISQLVDYSAYRIEPNSPAAVLPVEPSEESLGANAEYFTDNLIGSLSRNRTFQSVERKDLQAVLEELELQLSDLVDAAPRIGKILEAEMLVAGKLYRKASEYELFLKLLRVETGEILSVSQARIDADLGL